MSVFFVWQLTSQTGRGHLFRELCLCPHETLQSVLYVRGKQTERTKLEKEEVTDLIQRYWQYTSLQHVFLNSCLSALAGSSVYLCRCDVEMTMTCFFLMQTDRLIWGIEQAVAGVMAKWLRRLPFYWCFVFQISIASCLNTVKGSRLL